ncbi:hypothetical protein LCS82_08065 [Vibrio harveyi]
MDIDMNLLKRLSISIGVACLFSTPLVSYGSVAVDHSGKANDIAQQLIEMKEMAVKDRSGDTALHFAYTLEGYMSEPNFKLFFDWIKLSASRGNEDALYQAGLHYEYGIGLMQDVDLAVEYYSHIKSVNNDLSRVISRAKTRSFCNQPHSRKPTTASLDNRPTSLFGSEFTCFTRQSLEKLLVSGGAIKLSSSDMTDTFDGSEELLFSKRIYTDYSETGNLLNIRFYIAQVDVNDVLYEMRNQFGKEEPNYGVEAMRGKEWVWHRSDGIDITLIKDGEYSMLTLADISSTFVKRRQEVYPYLAEGKTIIATK